MRYLNPLLAVIVIGVATLVLGPVAAAQDNQDSQSSQNNTYVLATHAAYKPWEFINKDGEMAGIEVDMVKAIEESQGVNIKIVNMPWTAAIASTSQGKVDGVFGGMSVTEKRKKVVNYTRPIYRIDFAIVVQEDSDLNAITALTHGATTSANAGTTGASWIRNKLVKKGMDTELKLFDSYPAALQAVIKGKVDSVLIDGPTAKAYAKDMPIKIVGTISSDEYLAWAVTNNDPKGLLSILNAGLNEMIDSGKLAQIYSKWGLPPTIPKQ